MKCAAFLLALWLGACAQPAPNPAIRPGADLPLEDGRVEALLRMRPEKFAALLEHAPEFRMQVLLSEVVPGADGVPRLQRHGMRLDAEYFYPASSIKLLAALAACESIVARARASGRTLDLRTPLVFEPLFEGDSRLDRDPSHLDGGTLTLGHEMRKLFLISDNTAFNRLYDFLGRDELNRRSWDAGFPGVRLTHRLSSRRSADENRRSPATWLLPPGEAPLFEASRTALLDLKPLDMPGLLVGRAQFIGEQLVEGPMDCTHKNRASLLDLQDALVAVARPELAAPGRGYALSSKQREFLMEAMRGYPAESTDPVYDRKAYPDDWVKFLLPGLLRVVPREDLIVCGKVGLAFGFTIENSYVEDRRSGHAFFLAATLYTNADGVLNDDRYDYDEVALPFYADLGELLARECLRRD